MNEGIIGFFSFKVKPYAAGSEIPAVAMENAALPAKDFKSLFFDFNNIATDTPNCEKFGSVAKFF